jgi:hypothetical protein
LFVFVELLGFWTHRAHVDHGSARDRADSEVELIRARLCAGFETISRVALTPAGRDLVEALEARAGLRV